MRNILVNKANQILCSSGVTLFQSIMTSEEGLVDDKGVDEKIMKSLDLHPFLAYARRILSEPIRLEILLHRH